MLQFFGWISLNQVLNPQYMDVLFSLIKFHSEENSVLAFACINEILSKNYIPPEFEKFLIQIFKELFELLQAITSAPSLENIDPG